MARSLHPPGSTSSQKMLPLLEVADSVTEESEAAQNWADDEKDELRPLDTPFQNESQPAAMIRIRKDYHGKNAR